MEEEKYVRDSISQNISRSVRGSVSWSMEEAIGSGNSSQKSSHTEEALKWAALEKLPTYARLRTSIIKTFAEKGDGENSKEVHKEVDVRKLDLNDRAQLIDSLFRVAEEDNEKFLKKFRNRIDKYVIEFISVSRSLQSE